MRLHSLATFVHEVANHWDFTFRMARGRWSGGDYDKSEEYAGRMPCTWLRDCVVPYLEDAYPEDVMERLVMSPEPSDDCDEAVPELDTSTPGARCGCCTEASHKSPSARISGQ